MATNEAEYTHIGDGTFALSSSALGLKEMGFDAGITSNARLVHIEAFDNNFRWRIGTDPAASTGNLQETGDAALQLFGRANIDQIRLISATGTCNLVVTFFK